MERVSKKSLSIALLISAFVASAHALAPVETPLSPVVSAFRIRPQSLDNALKVSGETGLTHLSGEEWAAFFDVDFKYNSTFNQSAIARRLFGSFLIGTGNSNSCDNDCGETILIQGNQVENANPLAIRANDLNLDPFYEGALSFKPSISSFILNFNFYADLGEWCKGMFVRVYAPFVHTKWNLKMTETIKNAGAAAGTDFFESATEFFAGRTAPAFEYNEGLEDVEPTTVIRNPLLFHRMLGNIAAEGSCESSCSNSEIKNGFGEIRFEWGYDFWRCEDRHVGLYLAAAAPTGNKQKAQFLFSPLVGNGKFWELGVGFTGHYSFWKSESEESNISINTDLTVTHLFKTKQHRVFDLKGKPLSRYMSAAKMTASTNDLGSTVDEDQTADADITAVQFEWANELTPVANLTAQDLGVTIGAQLDFALWFNYTSGGFTFDLGYDLWLQTCEKFSCTSKCGPQLAAEPNTWVLVGNADPVGQGADTNLLYPLSFSDSTVGLNIGTQEVFANNAEIDDAFFAVNTVENTSGVATTQTLLVRHDEDVTDSPQIKLSNEPVFLSVDDIDLNQRSQGLSQKVFGHFGYRWDREGAVPFIGIGGEAEFGTGKCASSNKCDTDCNTSCLKNAISQWGVWAKVGVSFD